MRQDMPLVSVLINNFNYGQYLRDAIDSALNQTYKNIEVIVVDDGSTDNSREIIELYGNRIIPVFKENGGQASAFNSGFEVCNGDIICFLDSDDIWHHNKVARVVECANLNREAVLIYHTVQEINKEGKFINKPWPKFPMSGNIKEKVEKAGGWWPYPPTSALCLRRTYLERIKKVPEKEYRICADAFLADVAPFLGDILGFSEPLTMYRIHGSNNWNNTSHIQNLEKQLNRYELRVSGLNSALERIGIAAKVSLDDHWPYQQIKYKIGQNDMSYIKLVSLGLCFPSVPRVISRLSWVSKFVFNQEGVK